MANHQIGDITGVVDIRQVNTDTGTHMSSAEANYVDINHMRTRLAAINGSYYTAARLDGMTRNDMVYALRLADDPGSIK